MSMLNIAGNRFFTAMKVEKDTIATNLAIAMVISDRIVKSGIKITVPVSIGNLVNAVNYLDYINSVYPINISYIKELIKNFLTLRYNMNKLIMRQREDAVGFLGVYGVENIFSEEEIERLQNSEDIPRIYRKVSEFLDESKQDIRG